VLAVVDGFLWGAAWWALVPVERLDLTAVTLTAIVGVASLSAFVMHADVRVLAWHVVPMMLPNIFYSLTRQDSLGVYGAISLTTYCALLMLEAYRAQSRLLELLTLRFVHELVLQEREAALALAQHHSEAKSRFLASMSHEMRTPLHGILGLARLLHDDEIRPVAQRRLELIDSAGSHLLTVINDVLDVTKIEAGHVQIDQEPFNARDVMAAAAKAARTEMLQRVRETAPEARFVEIEVETLAQLDEAIDEGAHIVLLDNMSDAELERAVPRCHGAGVEIEVSGGITAERLPRLARLGVDYVSMGALTHSARAMDLSLEILPGRRRSSR